MQVTFKFEPANKVKTVFDELGIVQYCAVNTNKDIKYSVKTKSGVVWFKETELTIA